MSAFLHALLQLALCRVAAAVVAAVLVLSPMPGGAPAATLTLEDGPNRVALDSDAHQPHDPDHVASTPAGKQA